MLQAQMDLTLRENDRFLRKRVLYGRSALG